MVRRLAFGTGLLAATLLAAVPAAAGEPLRIERVSPATAMLERDDRAPVDVWLSADRLLDAGDRLVAEASVADRLELTLAADRREYVILVAADGSQQIVAERVLPLEQGSNFRDIGGYTTRDGRTVQWGIAYRSGAMPLLTEADYALLEQLDIGAVVDFRSLEEREVAANQLDDRIGALFLSNDYSIAPLMAEEVANDLRARTVDPSTFLAADQERALLVARILAHMGDLGYSPGATGQAEWAARAWAAYREKLDSLTIGVAGHATASTDPSTDTAAISPDQTYRHIFRKM